MIPSSNSEVLRKKSGEQKINLARTNNTLNTSMMFVYWYIWVRCFRWYFHLSWERNHHWIGISSLVKWIIDSKCMSFDSIVSIGLASQMWWKITCFFKRRRWKYQRKRTYRAFIVSWCYFMLIEIEKCYRPKQTRFE